MQSAVSTATSASDQQDYFGKGGMVGAAQQPSVHECAFKGKAMGNWRLPTVVGATAGSIFIQDARLEYQFPPSTKRRSDADYTPTFAPAADAFPLSSLCSPLHTAEIQH